MNATKIYLFAPIRNNLQFYSIYELIVQNIDNLSLDRRV